MAKLLYETKLKDLSYEEKIKLQKELDSKPSMTIPECAIWLDMSISTIKKYIKKGLIISYHPFGSKAVRVDTEATRKMIKRGQ